MPSGFQNKPLFFSRNTVYPNLFCIKPRLVFMRRFYENHLSKESCITRHQWHNKLLWVDKKKNGIAVFLSDTIYNILVFYLQIIYIINLMTAGVLMPHIPISC